MNRPLRSLLISLLALGLLAAAGAAPASAGKQIKNCNGQAIICDQPFNEVVLAGSHNAMSSASLDWTFPNQSITIPEQLEFGVRALLIDTHYGRERADGTVVTDDDGEVSLDVGPRNTYLCHV